MITYILRPPYHPRNILWWKLIGELELSGPQSCSGQLVEDKGKGKGHPRTGHEDPEGKKWYNSILSLPLALDGVGVQGHAPAALPRGKTRYPFIGGWVSLRAGPDGCRNSRLHRDSIAGPSSPQRVAIPTELSRSTGQFVEDKNILAPQEIEIQFLGLLSHSLLAYRLHCPRWYQQTFACNKRITMLMKLQKCKIRWWITRALRCSHNHASFVLYCKFIGFKSDYNCFISSWFSSHTSVTQQNSTSYYAIAASFPDIFQFISHESFNHSTSHLLSYWRSRITKLTYLFTYLLTYLLHGAVSFLRS